MNERERTQAKVDAMAGSMDQLAQRLWAEAVMLSHDPSESDIVNAATALTVAQACFVLGVVKNIKPEQLMPAILNAVEGTAKAIPIFAAREFAERREAASKPN